MKFTKSKDGAMRATLHVKVRVSEETLTWLDERSKYHKIEGPRLKRIRELLRRMLDEGWVNEEDREREDEVDRRYQPYPSLPEV